MKKLTILSILFAAFATQANAAVTTFTTEASWLSAVGSGSVLEDFNDAVLAAPLTSITGGSINSFPASGTGPFSGQQVFSGQVTSEQSITFNFSSAITGLGGLWNLAGPGGPGSNLTLNLVGGGVEVFTDYFSNTLFGTFQGFVASSAFTSMTLSNGTACCVETFELENLRMSPVSPVPEPETYAMLLAGLGLIGFIASRRKSDSSIMLGAA